MLSTEFLQQHVFIYNKPDWEILELLTRLLSVGMATIAVFGAIVPAWARYIVNFTYKDRRMRDSKDSVYQSTP